jgi:hypothetical protein
MRMLEAAKDLGASEMTILRKIPAAGAACRGRRMAAELYAVDG